MANFKRTSRYARRDIQENRNKQQFIFLREPLNLLPSSGDIYVTVDQELLQRPDLIAHRAYGDSELWWIIYEFNGISDPLFELTIGQVLRIPTLARVQTALADIR